ncbi:S41 family peptidase [Occallatibacter riparius]|uniref:S41 family peptidase n=1 Tax=Occallatibacter riparius TaxID=1002689 RepID=A0A9J7BSJ8_9BACT|nr:S41 family peptidase [Occallatibacter riparius]UWZ84005.1 S41 family peptidase [Occallatibacter riparius]
MTPRARRALFITILFFVACALVGSLLQRKVGAQSSEDESQIRDNLKQFTNVYALVEQNYAEPINGDKIDAVIYDGAIPGMLRTLDPHSNFYDPKAYAKMREDQRGHYYGVGMVIQQQKEKIYVITPYEGTPSFRAGIRPGDVITAVDGKQVVTEGNNPDALASSDAVAKALKGPKGTHVQVTMSREGQTKPLTFDLVRDEIPHPSVDLKYEIRPGVGYIHLTQFQETTAQEVIDAINSFGAIKGLVFDLRGNPGGLLSQAVEVCDHLLSKGQTIVSQRGRAYPDQNYTATHGNDGKAFPIVVLVNRNTASAAEIVSGALQDHDRALIVGETTFGKGLVQTVYNLSENTGLALTTYHYYTPSGRLIQRNYSGVSLYDYYYNHAGAEPADKTNREVKMTDSGRTVYGGGGITPDEKIDSPKANKFQDEVGYRYTFFHFAPHYLANHTVDKNFQVDDSVMNDFKQFLTSLNIPFTEKDIADNADWLKINIKEALLGSQFGQLQGLRVHADWDPEIQKALSFLPEAQALEDNAHKVLAEKAQAHETPQGAAAARP